MLEISNNVVCATSKASDQPAHTRSLIRAFASRLSISPIKHIGLLLFTITHQKLSRLCIWSRDIYSSSPIKHIWSTSIYNYSPEIVTIVYLEQGYLLKLTNKTHLVYFYLQLLARKFHDCVFGAGIFTSVRTRPRGYKA